MAAIGFKSNTIERVGLARHAVFLVTSLFTPGTVLTLGYSNCITELPKVISSFGNKNRYRIVTLQVLADTRRVARDYNFSSIATRRRSSKTFGLHIERVKQNRRRVRFIARPNPLGLCICIKAVQSAATRELVACVTQRRCAAPLRKIATLIFPRSVPHCRFRFPAGTGIIRLVEIVYLHHYAGSTSAIHAHDRDCIFTRQERHRDKAHTARLVILSQELSVVIEPVAAIGHNPNARAFTRIVCCGNQFRAHIIAATVSSISRKIHNFSCRNRRMHRRNSKNRDNARQNQTVRQITKLLNTHTFLTFFRSLMNQRSRPLHSKEHTKKFLLCSGSGALRGPPRIGGDERPVPTGLQSGGLFPPFYNLDSTT